MSRDTGHNRLRTRRHNSLSSVDNSEIYPVFPSLEQVATFNIRYYPCKRAVSLPNLTTLHPWRIFNLNKIARIQRVFNNTKNHASIYRRTPEEIYQAQLAYLTTRLNSTRYILREWRYQAILTRDITANDLFLRDKTAEIEDVNAYIFVVNLLRKLKPTQYYGPFSHRNSMHSESA